MTPEERILALCADYDDYAPRYDRHFRDALVALVGELLAAERERCATEAELVAENFRESAVLHGKDEPLACYNSRASGAFAVAKRIRGGVPS